MASLSDRALARLAGGPRAVEVMRGAIPQLGRGMYDNSSSGDLAPPGNSQLHWAIADNGQHQDDLLDLTDPGFPAVRVSGVYVVQGAVVTGDAADTEGNKWGYGVDIDDDGDDPNVQFEGLPFAAPAAFSQPFCIAYFCPAGGTLDITMGNNDTIAHTFFANIFIQQIA